MSAQNASRIPTITVMAHVKDVRENVELAVQMILKFAYLASQGSL